MSVKTIMLLGLIAINAGALYLNNTEIATWLTLVVELVLAGYYWDED